MNRKIRKATGHRALNSNQKYSPFLWNEAGEVGEMATMDHVGASVFDLDEDGKQLDYLEGARLLREKLNGFVEGGTGGPPGLELRSLLKIAASRKIVSVDPKKMSPVLWITLPKELLLRVFARLPLPDITRVRSLSNEWNRDMATVNSEINRECDETSRTTMVAGFPWGGGFPTSEFLVTICDLNLHTSRYIYRWYPGICGDRWVHVMVDWSVLSPHGEPAKPSPCALL